MKKFTMGFILALVTLVSAFAEQGTYKTVFDEDGNEVLFRINESDYESFHDKKITRYFENGSGLSEHELVLLSTDFGRFLLYATADLELAKTYQNADARIVSNLIVDSYNKGDFYLEGYDTDLEFTFDYESPKINNPYSDSIDDDEWNEIYSLENMRCVGDWDWENKEIGFWLKMDDGVWIIITISYFEEE